jgi:maltose O-acetyltransferase
MADKTEKAKMLAGELYRSADAALVRERRHAQQFLARYNAISDGDPDLLLSMLRDFMGAVGERTVVQPLFTCDYGYNIRLGRNAFINYHCVFLDCAPIEIGDDVQIGRPYNSIRPGIRLIRLFAGPAWSPRVQSGSATTSGLAARRWCFQA